jgi:lipopolysaccharide export system protein LptA
MVKGLKGTKLFHNSWICNKGKVGLTIITILSSAQYAYTQEAAKVQFTAATTEYNAAVGKDTKRLIGNVVFTHNGAKMYCDSAYFYSSKNSLDAFSNIYINQGDTVHLYGDFLNYNGNTHVAKVRQNVRLIKNEATLTTDSLEYNISSATGYYTHHADIVNQENHLESFKGYYFTRSDLFDFRDSVIVINPKYRITSDTLKYNTKSKTAYFFGPTQIVGDSNYIYCERGWYNTKTDISQLNRHALVKNKRQTVKGDSLYYEKLTGFGRGVNNVEIIDSLQNIILKGNLAIYYENSEFARLTDRAQFIQVSNGDSLFLHADTLLSELDTNGKKIIKAYYGVRIYKSDLQGKCDSLAYSFADSMLRFYKMPVLWNGDNQLNADFIDLQLENKQAKTMHLLGSSFISSFKDTLKFDQIKGKKMTCHFRNNVIYRIDVNGNGQTVYYPKDKDELIGANKAECSDLIIYIVNGKVNSIVFLRKPDATLYPLETAPINELILKGYKWYGDLRPFNKEDIFRK